MVYSFGAVRSKLSWSSFPS